MSDDQAKQRSQADADLEREILLQRRFTLAEAIGRLAGPGMMKGTSPVPRQRQAEAEIEEYLNRHLLDSAGVLAVVLFRQVKASDLLLNHDEQPLALLASYVQRVLDSEYLQQELVREADVEWGRALGERPHFEKEGCPPDADDPYTMASVRSSLVRLLERLRAGEA